MTIRVNGFDINQIDKTIVKIDCWYDRHQRIWVIQRKNSEGDQIDNAIYAFNKKDAKEITADLIKEYGL